MRGGEGEGRRRKGEGKGEEQPGIPGGCHSKSCLSKRKVRRDNNDNNDTFQGFHSFFICAIVDLYLLCRRLDAKEVEEGRPLED